MIHAPNAQRAQQQQTSQSESQTADGESKRNEGVAPPQTSTGIVSVVALRVRQGPSTQTAGIGSLRQGTVITITGEQGVWRRIDHNGQVGWVHGRYVDQNPGPAATHKVAPGESLFMIARRRLGDGNRWQEIAALNNISNPRAISAGQTLRLPAGANAVQEPVEGGLNDDGTYIVGRGDTLGKIAQKTLGEASRWREIANLNNILDPRAISVGQKLRIPQPVKEPAPAPEPGQQDPEADADQPQPQTPQQPEPAKGEDGVDAKDDETKASADHKVHIVSRGETLSKIAAEQLGDASRWREIAELNSISNPSAINVGQELRLPADAVGASSGATVPQIVDGSVANPVALQAAVDAAMGVVEAGNRARAKTHLPIVMAQCARSGITNPNQVAYVLATTEHESGFGRERYSRSQSLVEDHNPIKGKAGAYWAKVHAGRGGIVRGKTKDEVVTKYWDRAYGHKLGNRDGGSDGANYRGRGYVQLTGRNNYRKMADHLNSVGFTYELDGVTWGSAEHPIDLVSNFTHVNESPALAAAVLVEGSKLGMFTGHALDDHINSSKTDYTNARRVINGTDRASAIASIARRYQGAMSGLWAPVFVPDPDAVSDVPVPKGDADVEVTPGGAADAERETSGQEPSEGTEVKPQEETKQPKSDEPSVKVPTDVDPALAEPKVENEADSGGGSAGRVFLSTKGTLPSSTSSTSSTSTSSTSSTSTSSSTSSTSSAAPLTSPRPRPRPTPGEPASVTAGTLNVRSGPGTSHDKVGQLSEGDRIMVLEHQGSWAKIQLNGEEAWVHKGHIRFGAAEQGFAALTGREVHGQYREWLQARLPEVRALEPGQAQYDRASGLLWQAELHNLQLRHGEQLDIASLNTTPTAAEPISKGAVPPEWIQPLRQLITIVDTSDIEGGESDWSSRLGVPQYRTQSDNLVGPETTCAPTTLAMTFERLGLSRDEVVAGLDRNLGVADASPERKAQVWAREAAKFLAAEDSRGKTYQRLRGTGMGAQAERVAAGQLREDGQLEDLLLFMAFRLGINRFAITSSTAFLVRMIRATDSETADAVRATRLEAGDAADWSAFTARVGSTLNTGGSAILSIYHKGRRGGGTHIVSIQQVLSDGLVIDDPYGKIRADYRATRGNGDAYARRGQTARVTRNERDLQGNNGNDWHRDQAEDLKANESKGDSHTISRQVVQSAINYVTLVTQRNR